MGNDAHNKGEQDRSNDDYDPPRRPDFGDLVMNTDDVNNKMFEERDQYDKGWNNSDKQDDD